MFNLWLYWEAYKMCHPEARQVLEWQEQYYKAIGNGMAQPCADFVMQRVVEVIRNSKKKT